jgi:hypothetical protein
MAGAKKSLPAEAIACVTRSLLTSERSPARLATVGMTPLAREIFSIKLYCREVRLLMFRKVEMKDAKEPLEELGDQVARPRALCLLCDRSHACLDAVRLHTSFIADSYLIINQEMQKPQSGHTWTHAQNDMSTLPTSHSLVAPGRAYT